MGPIEIGKRRIYILLAACAAFFVLYNLLSYSSYNSDVQYAPDKNGAAHPPEPIIPEEEDDEWEDDLAALPDFVEDTETETTPGDAGQSQPSPVATHPEPDAHPIISLMNEADARWREYESGRSQTFRETVEKYRAKYGRHPPPGFREWYIYARKKNTWNIDDFDHIMDDLRPYWALPPSVIRIHAAHMWENPADGVAVLHIRNGTVAKVSNGNYWRTDTMKDVLNVIARHLPDMDVPMNRLDQPRLLVPWEDLQHLLEQEYQTRVMLPEATYNFTSGQKLLTNLKLPDGELDESEDRYNAEWFGYAGHHYMQIASKACPPESPARSGAPPYEADLLYKDPSGLVANFNLSSDLCTVGPTLDNLHGMLYAASSISASHKLVPIFSECKTNVNNDIMFPANMYWMHDDRYDYKPDDDVAWRDKDDKIIWRGVTSGGVQNVENWQTMHRQRLVQLMNGTYQALNDGKADILVQEPTKKGSDGFSPFKDLGLPSTPPVVYRNATINPGPFADQISDIGFVETWGCDPNCDFYFDVFELKPQTTLSKQFRSKYLIDVDGHSFSGRWHAFLLSKSLGFKATIFREWHDSRLFAWRHFVPVDNRYDDLYSLLTYFNGYGTKPSSTVQQAEPNLYIAPHQEEAKKLARQGREWANKVLRRDDIEVYMYRLMLEYGRIIDDNRDKIGYSGDGSELDRFDAGAEFEEDAATAGKSRWGVGGWFGGLAGPDKEKDKVSNHGVGIGGH